MTGKFTKAPLVYVSAKVRTTSMELTSEQKIAVSQAMIKCGLPHKEAATYQEIEVSLTNTDSPVNYRGGGSLLGYFSVDRKEALIMGESFIEWRNTEYDTFTVMSKRVNQILTALLEAVGFIRDVYTEELLLSYADLIYPINSHELDDYFAKGGSILPVNFIAGPQSQWESGRLEVTRVVEPDFKMHAEFEQIPFIDGKVAQSIPQSMLEPHNNFTMPVGIKYGKPSPNASHYGVLGTSASNLKKVKLGNFKFEEMFEKSHRLIDDAFKGLINKEVCDVDWEWEDTSS